MRRPVFRTDSADDINVHRHEIAYDGFNRLHVLDLSVKSYDGSWIGPIDREVIERCDSVVVLPYDPVRDEIVLVEQVRFGAYCADVQYRQLEPVAGLVDTDESQETIALREVQEECGAVADMIERVGSFLVSPGCLTEVCHVFVARINTDDVQEHCGKRSEGEDIKAHIVPLSEAESLIASQRLGVAISFLAVQWLLINRDRIMDAFNGPHAP